MAGSNVQITGLTFLKKRLDPKRVTGVMIEVAESVANEGVEAQRDYIRNESGTGKTWKGDWGSMPNGTPGRTGSHPGRVASGEMLDGVDAQVIVTSGNVIAEVGWLNDSPMWARLQENGYYHVIAQRDVAPMNSLRVARESGDSEMDSAISRAIRRL